MEPKQHIKAKRAHLNAVCFVAKKEYSKTIIIAQEKTVILEYGSPIKNITIKGNSNIVPAIRRLISESLSLINSFFSFLYD